MEMRTYTRAQIINATITADTTYDFTWSEMFPGSGRAISALFMLDNGSLTSITQLDVYITPFFVLPNGTIHEAAYSSGGYHFDGITSAGRRIGIVPSGFGHNFTNFGSASATSNHNILVPMGHGLRFVFNGTGTWGSVAVQMHGSFLIA